MSTEPGQLQFTVNDEPDPTPTTITLPVQTDTWIDEMGMTGPNGPNLWAGEYQGITERTYLKFDTSALTGKTITDAKLELWNVDSYGCGDSASGIKAQRVTTAWNAETLTWGNQPSAITSSEVVAKDPGGCSGEAPEGVTWTWPVTGIVGDWAAGQSNHGFLLRGVNESASAPLYDRGFHSAETEDVNPHPPALKVTYTDDTDPGPTPSPTTGPDTTAPTVIEVSPANEAHGVPLNTQLAVTFSEPVTDAQLSLIDYFDEANLAGSIVMSSGNTVLTFTPNASLEDSMFLAELSGAKDTAGNTMETYSWGFMTWDARAKSRLTTTIPDAKPTIGKMWTRPFATKNGTTVTSTTTPHLMAKVSDPLMRRSTVEFEVEHDPKAPSQGKGLIWSGTDADVSSRSTGTLQIPVGKLADGWKVRWRARAGAGTWSEWKQLVIASGAIFQEQTDSGAVKATTAAPQDAQSQFAPPDFPYDPIDFTQCWENMNRATAPGGYTKNSFNWCGSWYMSQSRELSAKSGWVEANATTGFVAWRFSYAIRTAVGNKVSKRKGMSQAQLDAAKAAAEVGARNVEVWVFVDQVKASNQPDSPEMFDESSLAIGFEMKSDPGGACKPLAGHNNSVQSRTFRQWNTNHQHQFRFTSDKLSSRGANRVAACTLIPTLYYDGTLPGEEDEYIYDKPLEKLRLQKAFRCDTSDLILMHYGGCVFDQITPTLGLSTANTLEYKDRTIVNNPKEHAIHIKEAMTSGKKIPGSPDRIIQNPLNPTPLTRAWPGNHSGDTEYENRKVVQTACADAFGADWFARTKKQCDEYPFANTLEGAASTFFDYSIKLIPVTPNTAAGATQTIFWQRYRILPGDTFYVKIYSGQPPE